MTVSNSSGRSRPRWLQTCVLLYAMIVLPLGVASAQDLEAVWARLQTAVKKGEISGEQADIMMGALKKSLDKEKHQERAEKKGSSLEEIGHWVKSVGDDLGRAAVEKKITEAQAWEKWRGFKEGQLGPKLKDLIKEGRITEEDGLAFWREVEMHEAQARLRSEVEKGRMSEQDAERKMGEIKKRLHGELARHAKDRKEPEARDHHPDRSEGIKAHFNKLGVDDGGFGRINDFLKEKGLEDEQIGPALGGILRTVHEMRSEGEGYELDPRMSEFLRKQTGLNDDQVELVEGIARRVLQGLERGAATRSDSGDEGDADLKPVPKEVAQKIGQTLAKLAGEISKPQVKINADPGKAVGVAVADVGGILLVPRKGMQEGEEIDLTVGNGAPFAMFFSSAPLLPKVDGKLVGRDRLHAVTFKGDDGENHQVNCMLMSVKKISDEEYRLYGFGKGDKPIIDVQIHDGDGPDTMPVAMEIIEDHVVVTIYGKYQAKFPGGLAE